jgi:hypothetical protein
LLIGVYSVFSERREPMKRSFVVASLVGLLTLGAAVYAQAPGGYGYGMGPGMMMGPGMGWGHGMGYGMMGEYGYPCGGPGMMGPGRMHEQGTATPQTQLTEESAKEAAQQYADRYLKGFTVEKVLPFTGMGGMTMYQAELKGPKDELRTLHINPWGNVMPFGSCVHTWALLVC